MTQQAQQQDDEHRHRISWEVARRAHFAFMDGYFTKDEFEHLLFELGIHSEWSKHADSR